MKPEAAYTAAFYATANKVKLRNRAHVLNVFKPGRATPYSVRIVSKAVIFCSFQVWLWKLPLSTLPLLYFSSAHDFHSLAPLIYSFPLWVSNTCSFIAQPESISLAVFRKASRQLDLFIHRSSISPYRLSLWKRSVESPLDAGCLLSWRSCKYWDYHDF